jgi:hypothetical protein
MANTSYLEPATAVGLTGVNQTIATPMIFMGLSVCDDGTGASRVHVYHGTSDNGLSIAATTVPNNGDDSVWYGPNGVLCPNGIFIKVYSGVPEGAVFYR